MEKHPIDQPYVPTGEQIQRACEKIRRSWSERQRREREVTRYRDVQVPHYSLSSLAVDVPGLDDERGATPSWY
jgi:hypothetical protein